MELQDLKLSHSLNLASDISLNFVIPATELEGFDMDTVYVESTVEMFEGNEKLEAKTVRIEPVRKEHFYYFTLSGLTAVQMNDCVASVLYGTKDGTAYCSPKDEYSVGAYAYAQLDKPSASKELKTLCADLLRYGAAAQIYKGYRTDSLADGAMTEEHKTFLSDMDALTFGNNNSVETDVEKAPVTWVGKSLDLGSKIMVKFVVNCSAYTGDPQSLSLRVSYFDVDGELVETILTGAEAYGGISDCYAFTFDGLLAAELRSVVSAQVFAGQTPVSCTLRYSADTYGINKTGALGALCKALFAYSDSAMAYFNVA